MDKRLFRMQGNQMRENEIRVGDVRGRARRAHAARWTPAHRHPRIVTRARRRHDTLARRVGIIAARLSTSGRIEITM
jgi:hypothetical protein